MHAKIHDTAHATRIHTHTHTQIHTQTRMYSAHARTHDAYAHTYRMEELRRLRIQRRLKGGPSANAEADAEGQVCVCVCTFVCVCVHAWKHILG